MAQSDQTNGPRKHSSGPGKDPRNLWIMEKKMETTIVFWGHIGIMEKKMETTIVTVPISG